MNNVWFDFTMKLINIKNETIRMTFKELKAMASEQSEGKNRHLYRVFKGGVEKADYQTFKLMKDDEVDSALYKNRIHRKNHFYTKINLASILWLTILHDNSKKNYVSPLNEIIKLTALILQKGKVNRVTILK